MLDKVEKISFKFRAELNFKESERNYQGQKERHPVATILTEGYWELSISITE